MRDACLEISVGNIVLVEVSDRLHQLVEIKLDEVLWRSCGRKNPASKFSACDPGKNTRQGDLILRKQQQKSAHRSRKM